MLAGRGKLLVALGVFLLTFGFTTGITVLAIIGVTLVLSSLVTAPIFEAMINVEDLKVTRFIDKTKVFQDDFLHVVVEIKNTGDRRFDFVEIKDLYPYENFNCVIGDPFISTRIDPKKTVRFSYVLKPRIRGEFFLGPVEVHVKDRLEFNDEAREIPESYTQLVVYPPYADLRKLDALHGRTLGKMFGAHRSVQVGTGSEFHGIREYQFGDEFRRINWRATARMNRLFVREVEQEKNTNVLCVVDTSSTMGAGALLNTKLEYALRAAMVLCKLTLDHKDSFGMGLLQNNPRKKDDLYKGVSLLESKSGENQLFSVLDFMGTARSLGPKSIGLWIDAIVRRLRKRHLIVLISDMEAPVEDIRMAFTKVRARSHELIVITPFSPWFEVFGREFKPVERALAEAISEEMMQHVLEVRQIGQSFGFPVIPAGPDDIIGKVIDEYLKAKSQGKALI